MHQHDGLDVPDQLLPDHTPETIINRDEEQNSLVDAFSGPGFQHLYIHGPRGTGKTLLARSSLAKQEDGPTTCHLSCIQCDTQYRVLKQLYRSLTGDDINNGYHTAQLQDRVQDLLTGRDTLVILDEIDFLLDHDGSDLLYYLSRLPTDARLGLVAISANHPDPRAVIDQRTLSSMQPLHVPFDRYPAEQAYDILEARLQAAGMMDTVDREALTYLVTRTRNIRLGLHWLTQAATASTDRVTIDVLQDVAPAAAQRYRDDLLSEFTTHHQLLFEAITQVATEAPEVHSGMVYDRYAELCQSTNTNELSTRRLCEFVTDLELLDIIQADQYHGGTFGRTRRIQLNQFL